MRRRFALAAFCLALMAGSLAQDSDPAVYATKTGKKYHTAKCSSLRGSKVELKLGEAKKRGRTTCSRCKPPT